MFILMIFVALGVIFLIFYNIRGEKRAAPGMQGEWIPFGIKGKDAGFSAREVELLRQLAARACPDDPMSLFWSQEQLDRCIKDLVRIARTASGDKKEEMEEFLARLYNYRKKIELDKPKSLLGINSTRELAQGQRLRVLVSGTGVFGSQIVKNTRDYLTVTRPSGEALPQSYKWKGSHISIYFWRNEDAGYTFETDVLDEVYSRGIPALQIKHTESVFRTQKRKSTRIKTHLPAYLYLLADGQTTASVESSPGLKCLVEDLSDGGCALSIGGKTAPGLRIKVQFELEEEPLVMCGTVRSVDYRETENRSLLHVEAESLPLATKNHILAEVFGMIDSEEDLPLRIVDGEEDDAAGKTDPVEAPNREDVFGTVNISPDRTDQGKKSSGGAGEIPFAGEMGA